MFARLRPLAPVAALAGGLCLLVHYALHIAHGVQTGGILWEAMTTPLGRIDGPVFILSFAALDVAVLSLAARLDGAAPRLARTGAGFAVLALVADAVGFVAMLAGGTEPPPMVMPVATLAMFVGALMVGIAALRTSVLPRTVGAALVAFALATAPLGFATEALGRAAGLPAYVGFEAHFTVAALLWLYVAVRLREERAPAAAPSMA